eukprot:m51a1_g4966 hypothetical protein (339) ;mRNA; r:385460-386532
MSPTTARAALVCALAAAAAAAWWQWAAATDVHPLIRLSDLVVRSALALGLPPVPLIRLADAACHTSPRSVPGVANVSDTVVAGVPVRYYAPAGPAAQPETVVVWLHGGGWVLGSAMSWQVDVVGVGFARRGVAMLAVEYRKAPEHPFPQPLRDCEAVVRAVLADEREGRRVVVGGDSAGANMAGVIAALVRDDPAGLRRALDAQVLVYPSFFVRGLPSAAEYRDSAFLLSVSVMDLLEQHYINGTELEGKDPATSPLITPLATAQGLRGLPRSIIVTAKHDLLRDSGALYHKQLGESGVQSVYKEFRSSHGFISFPLDVTERAMDFIVSSLLQQQQSS